VRTVVHYLAGVCKQNLSNQTTHGAFRRLKPPLGGTDDKDVNRRH